MICQSYPYRHVSDSVFADNTQSRVLLSLLQICSGQLFERSTKISFAAITFILTISDHDTATTLPWLATLKKHRYISLALPQTHTNSQSMLYRFREQQAAERGLIDTGSMRRPKVITQVDSIPVC